MSDATLKEFRKKFANPPGEFRPMPLWVWNGDMGEKRIVEMLEAFAEQGMGGVFVHPRPGLRTEYLSKRWFELWNFAAEHCRSLGLQCNIYDENSYPSGFAGGHVVSSNPRLGKVRVEIKTLTAPPSKEDELFSNPLAVCSKSSPVVEKKADLSQASPSNPMEVLYLSQDRGLPWLAGFPYADLSKAETTEAFIRCTHEAYHQHCGKYFGDTIRYVFTDEPTLQSLGDYGKSGLVYSHAIEAEFRRDHGYGLLDNMNRLMFDLPDSAAVRFDYGRTLDRLFTTHFVGLVDKWCLEHKVSFTGHFNEHHWPLPGDPPNVMTALRRMAVPGNDMLGFQFSHEDRQKSEHFRLNLHELRSVANQFGKKRTLVESCGGGGYEFTLKQTKALEDFLLVHGVNLMNPHLCYETLSGCRKYDWPQTFTDHAPWMDAYREQADHVARVAWTLSGGEEINRILVLHPTLSSWLMASYGSSAPLAEKKLKEIRANQDLLLNELCHAQLDFDLGDELLMEEAGFVKPGRLGIGRRQYEALVLPETVTCLAASTVNLLRYYLSAGGRVLALCEPPSLVDGRPSEAVRDLARDNPGWKHFAHVEDLVAELARSVPPRITGADGKALPPEICFRRVEKSPDECLYYFCNPWSREVSAEVRIPGKSLDVLDTRSGKITPHSSSKGEGTLAIPLVLPPASHALFLVSQSAAVPVTAAREPVWSDVEWTFSKARRSAPNVLTLDYCDLDAHHVSLKSVPAVRADQACWEAMGFQGNIWRGAIQFRDNFLHASIANPGPFSVAYRFHIAAADLEKIRPSLRIAVERPHLYRFLCNGAEVEPETIGSWFDEEIGSIPIGPYVREGDNTFTLHAGRFTVLHEIAPAYLVGEFSTRACGQAFELVAAGNTGLGDWAGQGLHFYKDGVRYAGTITLPAPARRLSVRLGRWKGSLARIHVNGRLAGRIWREPFGLEIEMPLGEGTHEIDVEVVGNLKNFLGFHFDQGYPLAGTWERAPIPQPSGSAYQFEPMGLYEPVSVRVVPAL